MNRQVIFVIALVAALLWATPNGHAETARERLHETYRILVEADALCNLGRLDEAKGVLRNAISELERLQRAYPGWQSEVLSARLAHARNRLVWCEEGGDPLDDVHQEAESGNGNAGAHDADGFASELEWRKEVARYQERLRVVRSENLTLKSRLQAMERMPPSAADQAAMPDSVRDRLTQLLISEAERLQAEGETEEAIELLESAQTFLPATFDLRLALGVAYCRTGRFTPASKLLREAAAEQPDNVTARLALGAAWTGLGRLGAARAEIEDALAADPENADAHYNMARLLMMLPDSDALQARRHYRHSLSLGGAQDRDLEEAIQGAALRQFGRDR